MKTRAIAIVALLCSLSAARSYAASITDSDGIPSGENTTVNGTSNVYGKSGALTYNTGLANGNITIGSASNYTGISGHLTVHATGFNAYGAAVRATGLLTVYGGIPNGGSLTVIADSGGSYGFFTESVSINNLTAGTVHFVTTGGAPGIAGAMTISTGGVGAFGIKSGTSPVIIDGGIASTANLQATAGSGAVIIDAQNGITIDGGLAGTLTATTTIGDEAYILNADGDADTSGMGVTIYAPITINGDVSATMKTSSSGSHSNIISNGSANTTGANDLHITGGLTGSFDASAGGIDAAVIKTYGNVRIDKGLSPTHFQVSARSGAFGIFASRDMTIGLAGDATHPGGTGGINTALTVAAGRSSSLLESFGLMNIYGGIASVALTSMAGSSTTGGDGAIGLFGNGIGLYGDMAGQINAKAYGNSAYGIDASSGTLDLNGAFTSSAEVRATTVGSSGNTAYAISGNRININDSFVAGSVVAATAGQDDARAISAAYSPNADGILVLASTASLNGLITATAGRDYAYGLYARNLMTLDGTLNSTISATATRNYAYAVSSLYDVTLNSISSTSLIEAKADNGSNAYGISSDRTLRLGATTIGLVTSEAETSFAYGVRAKQVTLVNPFVGNILVTVSNGNGAVGINAYGGQAFGDVFGLNGGSSTTIASIPGTITATAKGAAAGILAWGPMYLDITGTVTGDDTSDSGKGYSVKSGELLGTGDFRPAGTTDDSGGYTDNITVEQSGHLVGHVDLAKGDDIMTLKDSAIVDGGVSMGTSRTTNTAPTDVDQLYLYNASHVNGSVTTGESDDTLEMSGTSSITNDVVLGLVGATDNQFYSYALSDNDKLTMSDDSHIDGNVMTNLGNDEIVMSGRSRIAGNVMLGTETTTVTDNDRITMTGSSRIQGTVGLGKGDDVLSMSGSSAIENSINFGTGNDTLTLAEASSVPVGTGFFIDGGSGGETAGVGDTIKLSNWQGQITDAFVGWERVEVVDSSTAILDLDDILHLAPTTGQELTVFIQAGSTIQAMGNSPGRYEILGNVANSGTLDLRDTEANDRVTVSGTYTGGGSVAKLGLDVAMGADQNVTNDIGRLDLLVVGAAAGQTTISIRNITVGQAIAMTEGAGILLVQVTGSNESTASFNLDTSVLHDGAQASIVKGGADHSGAENWYLVITQASSTGGGGGPTTIPVPGTLKVMQVVSTAVPVLGYDSMPRFHERQAYGWSAPGQIREPASWWSRATGSRFISSQESGGESVRASGYRSTMQVGADLSACGCGQTMYRTGVYAGTGYLSADSKVSGGVNAGRVDVFSLGIGGYASVEKREHWYAEGVVQADSYDVDAKFGDSSMSSAGTWGYGASVEGGVYLKVSDKLRVEPQAQVMWQRIAGYGMTIAPASRADVQEVNGLTGRIGVTCTAMPEGWRVSPFVEMNAVHDFGESSKVTYEEIGQTYRVSADRTWLGGAVGVVSRNTHPESLEYYLKAGLMAGVDGHAGRDYTITAGIRKSW
jgi:outer membrane autotransporter protein